MSSLPSPILVSSPLPSSSSPKCSHSHTRCGSSPELTSKKTDSDRFFLSPKKKVADCDTKDEETSDASFLADELDSTETATDSTPIQEPGKRRDSLVDFTKESPEERTSEEMNHLENVKSVFHKFDKLNNGSVFLSEFADVVRYLFPDAPKEEISYAFCKIVRHSSGDFDFETNAHKFQVRLNALQHTPNYEEFLQCVLLTYQWQQRTSTLPTQSAAYDLDDDPLQYAQALGHDCELYMVREDTLKTIANQLWQWISVHGIPAIAENSQLQKENEELKQRVDELKPQLIRTQKEMECEKKAKERSEKECMRLNEECGSLRHALERVEDVNRQMRVELKRKSQQLQEEADFLKKSSDRLVKSLTELADFKSKFDDTEPEAISMSRNEEADEETKRKETIQESTRTSADFSELKMEGIRNNAESESDAGELNMPIVEELDTERLESTAFDCELDWTQSPVPKDTDYDSMFDDARDAQSLANELRHLKRSHAEQRVLLTEQFDSVKTSVAAKRDTEARDDGISDLRHPMAAVKLGSGAADKGKNVNAANILDALKELTHSTAELVSIQKNAIESVERIGEVSEKTKESVDNVHSAISDLKFRQASASAPLPQGDDSDAGASMRTDVDPSALVEAVSDKIDRQLEKLEDNLRREHLNELKTCLSFVCKAVCGEESADMKGAASGVPQSHGPQTCDLNERLVVLKQELGRLLSNKQRRELQCGEHRSLVIQLLHEIKAQLTESTTMSSTDA